MFRPCACHVMSLTGMMCLVLENFLRYCMSEASWSFDPNQPEPEPFLPSSPHQEAIACGVIPALSPLVNTVCDLVWYPWYPWYRVDVFQTICLTYMARK
jgi:hypothetical protein